MLKLRPYQEEAIDAVYCHLRQCDGNPVVVIPTGGGKTPILASICKDAVNLWNGRVLILAHVKELLQQSIEHLKKTAPEIGQQVGVYSAGLGGRDTEHPVIVAGIQSVYKRADRLGHFDLAIVDEAHLIPPDGEGMYRTLLAGLRQINPLVRIIGLTATPFRMTSGSICAPENFLNHICFEIGVKELIVQGYLCPLRTKSGRAKADTANLHIRGGEFVKNETEALMDTDPMVEAACREIVEYTQDRKSVLIFASGVNHGRHIAEVLGSGYGMQAAAVFGDTLPGFRNQALDEFRAGTLKYLINANLLTTGFDVPNIDCVAMLRPTMSAGLYYQMVGRGFRLHPGKQDCLVLDFGGNVLRHGPVDAIRIHTQNSWGNGEPLAKECPDCHSLIATGCTVCPDCGHEFFRHRQTRHDSKASTAGILSGEVTKTKYKVRAVFYSVHTKMNAAKNSPKTMRVEYRTGWYQYHSEYICFEHTGWARWKAHYWWRRRSDAPVPETVTEAVDMAESGCLCETKSITVRSIAGQKFDRIVGHELGEKPEYCEPSWQENEPLEPDLEPAAIEDSEVPF